MDEKKREPASDVFGPDDTEPKSFDEYTKVAAGKFAAYTSYQRFRRPGKIVISCQAVPREKCKAATRLDPAGNRVACDLCKDTKCFECTASDPTYRIAVRFNRTQSWVVRGKENDAGLWMHEVTHFRLGLAVFKQVEAEIRALRISEISCDEQSARRFAQNRFVDEVDLSNENAEIRDRVLTQRYDRETKHGTVQEKQTEWQKTYPK